ncbi:peptidoglycan-binding domain-containing protein [Streptomyces sp. 8N114]|uniref:peptidoglycan-binding domain-containing protein n=1 Tax=Streptomyces sp. 8N114 TaxID=3457419 RepID=UPI003FD692ED
MLARGLGGGCTRGRATIPTPTLNQGDSEQGGQECPGLLLARGHNPGPTDGDFGPVSVAATNAFQEAADIPVDGQIGPITWGALLNHFQELSGRSCDSPGCSSSPVRSRPIPSPSIRAVAVM